MLNLFDMLDFIVADVDGVKEDDFMLWLKEDIVVMCEKDDLLGIFVKIKVLINLCEVVVCEWLVCRVKIEVLVSVNFDCEIK